MKKTIKDIDVNNKRVLLRVDFNVPLDENGFITDDTRIKLELPTIKYLLQQNAKVIICSHLGRPNGEKNQKYSLLPVAKYLVKELLGRVFFVSDCVGDEVEAKTKCLKPGEVLLLENVRFYKEEESNDPIFAKNLARLADIYVNDAFGTAHRKHASTFGVAELLPNAVGFLMGKEINAIKAVIDAPERPLVAILGGAKVSDKITLINHLVEKCNTLLIGGGMAYTFLKAQGVNVGNSLVDDTKIEVAKEILAKAQENNVKIVLPIDYLCATEFSPNARAKKFSGNIPNGWQGLDIGPKTVKLFKKEINNANSIVWNGPLGVFEFKHFCKGTETVAKLVLKFKGKAVVGGGDSVSAIKKVGNTNKIYHVSSGGGASLKLMAGESLPGVAVIEEI
ncbi:MAG: phosphoglycerate kinase [Clostridiales bacterium]|nr:phosphoglycerate kinase [Clostridiales bacterium]